MTTEDTSPEIPKPPELVAHGWRRVGRAGLFLVAFLAPFFFWSTTEDPIGINKFVLVSFLALAVFVAFLGAVLEEKKFSYPHSWFSLLLLLFIISQGVSTFFSIAISRSIFGSLRYADSFAGVLMVALIFFLSTFFFRRGDLSKIGMAIGGGVLSATIIGVISVFRGSGFIPLGSGVGWGIFMAATIVALTALHPDRLPQKSKILFFVSAFIAFAVLFILNYEWLWLAVAIFAIFVAALRFGPRERFHYAFAIIVLALFFGLVSSRLPALAPGVADVRPDLHQTFSAVEGAMHGWRSIIGTGPATLSLGISTYPTLPADQGYSFALTLLATGGIVSFLLFMLLIAAAIGPFFKLSSLGTDLAVSVAGSTFLILTLFLYQAFLAGFVIIFLLIGAEMGDFSRREAVFLHMSRSRSFLVSVGIMVLAALSLATAFVLGEKYTAAVLFQQSNTLAAAGRLDDAFRKATTAIALDRSDEYLRGASQILIGEARQLAAQGNISNATGLPSVVASAVQTAQSAVAEGPLDTANWVNLGSVYEAIMPIVSGADQLAESSYEKAAVLDPANPEWDLAAARVYLEAGDLVAGSATGASSTQQNDWASAENLLEQSIAIDDSYADARVLLIQLYLKEGDITQAIQRVQELKQQNPLDPGIAFELGYLYYEDSQMDQAQEEFQMATLLDPNYSNARYFLGLIYENKNMTPQALDQFERVQVLNPNNAEVQSIIESLKEGQAPPISSASSTLSGSAGGNEIAVPVQPPAKTGKK